MPDDVSRPSGRYAAAHPHGPAPQGAPAHASQRSCSQHTSSHSADLHSVEHTPTRVLLPPPPAHASAAPGLPQAPPLRVLIADDNPVVRAGLTALMQGRPDIHVVAEAADGRQACEAALRTRPDVVLLDVRMPGVDGLSALPHLARIAPVMMLTYSRESGIVHESLRLGARGYLVHGEFTAEQLAASVRDLTEGRTPFTVTASTALLDHARGRSAAFPLPPDLAADPEREPESPGRVSSDMKQSGVEQQRWATNRATTNPRARPGRHRLSEREVEVMELIASGMTNSQIAATCFISEKTVKNHINRIFTKLGVTTRSEAIAHWLGTARRPGGAAGSGGGGR